MQTLTKLFMILVISLGMSGIALAEKGGKGKGAGGARAEHASDMGLEKGKAYAGNKEDGGEEAKEDDKPSLMDDDSDEDKEKKEKKDKKEKKEKTEKKSK